ncbi:DNA methyltransferase [Aquiluna sp.]|nr:DNA methyltransferase [Aquiluna sp.]
MQRQETLSNILENQPQAVSEAFSLGGVAYERMVGEFWTSAQRQAANLHEVSYRACFKPQLPAYFLERFAKPGDLIYDPFSGRGTTAIEAALSGHMVAANDINPLSTYLTKPRLNIPDLYAIEQRLSEIPNVPNSDPNIDLSMFYEDRTLGEIAALRDYLIERDSEGTGDNVDDWIRMVATNRLTGHSPGFFSVYSMPPNQAVSAARQAKINAQRGQAPEYRDTRSLIMRKSRQLQKGLSRHQVSNLQSAAKSALLLNSDAACTPEIEDRSVQLVITSPPFLDVVQYSDDNWLRGWFNGIDMKKVSQRITMSKTLDQWNQKMSAVFAELFRVVKPRGVVAFEVGEVRNGKIKLEDAVVPVGIEAGFRCLGVLINTQEFTKTSNIWGIANNSRGTNSNRIVVFQR